jgi:meso-butanediol dehydrogenase / (S,S)-butanediol dehydrogenase / diacetyl reductase
MRYTGRLVVVTGAASGIGKATARRMAAEGATLVLGDINAEGLAATASELGAQATAVVFDAGDPESCRMLIARAAERGPIDMLCNIAGILDWAPLADFEDTRWDRMMRINLGAVFHLSRAAMPHLLATKGNIVNISSAAGLVGVAYSAAYCASKHGVIGLTKSMAIEFAQSGVRINAVCPTGVKTPMTTEIAWPEGIDTALLMRNISKMGEQMIDPEDVAATICFLGSDDARYISGIAMPVDGAQTAG